MLCHPDKIGSGGENPDKVYIANRCFAAITEAYNIFKVRKFKALIHDYRKKKEFSEIVLNKFE